MAEGSRGVSVLDKIVEKTRGRVEAAKAERSIASLEEAVLTASPLRPFERALTKPGMSIIAEFKRKSPSAGDIAMHVSLSDYAVQVERGGARALSVVTEPEFFGGSQDSISEAREACGLPVLRKDFMVDEYQIVEARAAGADAVLLIVAALEVTLLSDLLLRAQSLGMPSLVEVHDESEIGVALQSGATILGINQRDLKTFEVDKSRASRLRQLIPSHIVVVAESGLATRQDIRDLEMSDIGACLIGESLMRSADPERAVRGLLEV